MFMVQNFYKIINYCYSFKIYTLHTLSKEESNLYESQLGNFLQFWGMFRYGLVYGWKLKNVREPVERIN